MGYKVKHIYCGTNLVRPVWKPNANTLAYYPLTASTTVNDQSGNGNNMTNQGSVTFGTNAGVSCGVFTGASTFLQLSKALWTGNNPFTVSLWFYHVPNASYGVNMIWGVGNNSTNNGLVFYHNDNGYLMYGNWVSNKSTGTLTPNNSWNLLTVTFDGTTLTVYLNGNSIYSNTETFNLTNTRTVIGASLNTSPTSKWCGYLSEAIFENKAWDSAEVKAYYNRTKSLYGIS